MNRILVIGLNGAGKSTFAYKLGKKLGREVIHLDYFYYNSGWKQTFDTREGWREKVRELVSGESWIIDGNYNSTLDIRIPPADTIFFFNFNKFFCLLRSFKRMFDKTKPFDKKEGNSNRISWRLIWKTLTFSKRGKLYMLEQYKNTKKIIVFRNDRGVEKFLESL